MNTVRRWPVLCLLALSIILVVHPVAGKGGAAALASWWGTRVVETSNAALDSVPVVPFGKDSPFMIGLYNDGDFLYVLLRTSDAAARAQMLREGLIVWFDPKGGTKKEFGIQYPTPQRGRGRFASSQRGADSDSMWAQAQADGALDALEVLGPKKEDRLRLVAARTDDPAVRISSVEGTVTYQLKVPLSGTGQYHHAIGRTPGSVIGLGLGTPDPFDEIARGPMGGGGRGGGGHGGGRGGRGGYGGYGGQGRSSDLQQSKPIKVWTTVQLAAEPRT